jgi:hypothetical protein
MWLQQYFKKYNIIFSSYLYLVIFLFDWQGFVKTVEARHNFTRSLEFLFSFPTPPDGNGESRLTRGCLFLFLRISPWSNLKFPSYYILPQGYPRVLSYFAKSTDKPVVWEVLYSPSHFWKRCNRPQATHWRHTILSGFFKKIAIA